MPSGIDSVSGVSVIFSVPSAELIRSSADGTDAMKDLRRMHAVSGLALLPSSLGRVTAK